MFKNPNPLVAERIVSTSKLRQLDVDPYLPDALCPKHSVEWIIETEKVGNELDNVSVMGRLVSTLRWMGKKSCFVDLLDDGQRIQLSLREDTVNTEQIWQIVQLLHPTDIVFVRGRVFRTRKGELTIAVEELTVVCKPTHPLPLVKKSNEGEFNQIVDAETVYRHRQNDLINNTESRKRFVQRSAIINEIRTYFHEENFLEVETPVLGESFSGAAARPFKTFLNAKNQEVYLRISPECYLKRLLVSGFPRVYEIGKNFRNEGIDATHNPEFTMMEWYEQGSDYLHQMERFESLVSRLAGAVHCSTRIQYQGTEIDLSPPWQRMPMIEAVSKRVGFDVSSANVGQLIPLVKEHHKKGEATLPTPPTWGACIVALFEALVEPNLWQPTFVMDHPIEISPLTKTHRNDKRLVERFEPFVAGMEVGNAYSELNDPIEQYERLVSQQVTREEQYDLDEDFLQAICHGMPQAGGTGLGIDRVVMILTDAKSIRDVIFFPFFGRNSKCFEGKQE